RVALASRVAASLLAVACVVAASLPSRAFAQRSERDHLTPQEIELVRDAQEIDLRTAVFVKAVERRMRIITGQSPEDAKEAAKKEKGDKLDKEVASAEWGDLPKATRAELLYDVAHILDEAIENVDDTAQHNPKSPLLPKAVRKLSDACTRWLAQLVPMRETTADKAEREQLEQAIDNAQQIVEAAKKLPAEEKDAKPGKKG
ncbi:MAG: hypothetical protein LC746_09645, partial [Acidobacteria bacterium]|nr:hypothetical protein [Acidobacteriota bacterium]